MHIATYVKKTTISRTKYEYFIWFITKRMHFGNSETRNKLE